MAKDNGVAACVSATFKRGVKSIFYAYSGIF